MSMISEQIEELRLMAEMFVNGEPYGNLLMRAADTIEMLSEKAREPKCGEWIDKGWKGDWQFETDGRGNCWYEYKCSECGYIKRGGKSNYCPNCGAYMRERKDERDYL